MAGKLLCGHYFNEHSEQSFGDNYELSSDKIDFNVLDRKINFFSNFRKPTLLPFILTRSHSCSALAPPVAPMTSITSRVVHATLVAPRLQGFASGPARVPLSFPTPPDTLCLF